MLRLTKIFHFETAHALDGYKGKCRNIHGHSYELHVTIILATDDDNYIAPPGFLMDFKELKQLVNQAVVEKLDHNIVLSNSYIAKNPAVGSLENLVVLDAEPSAENLLLYSKDAISKLLPANVKLYSLKLYETKDSYAEWVAAAD